MRIAVCDDEKYFRDTICEAIGVFYHSPDVLCLPFESGGELIAAFEKGQRFDAVFLDIEMPPPDGMETAKRLHEFSPGLPVIFLTSHTELAMDGYEVGAFRFLQKPVVPDKLTQTLKDITQLCDRKKTVCIRENGEEHFLPPDDIIYAEADNNSVRFVTAERVFQTRMKLTEAAIPSVLMLMSVSVLLLLSVKQQQARRFREMNELSEKYMTAQTRHFEQSRAADTEMRMLRHDMNNHIMVMKGLFDSGRTNELGEYLNELGTAFSDTQAVNITGSEIADAIIYEKKKYAELNGASLVTEGDLKGLDIGAVTLCTVLSNLLDNAIEAAAQTDTQRVVTLSAKKSGSFYYICISNPTASIVDVSADIPTSKSDSAGHGLGLKSVRRAMK